MAIDGCRFSPFLACTCTGTPVSARLPINLAISFSLGRSIRLRIPSFITRIFSFRCSLVFSFISLFLSLIPSRTAAIQSPLVRSFQTSGPSMGSKLPFLLHSSICLTDLSTLASSVPLLCARSSSLSSSFTCLVSIDCSCEWCIFLLSSFFPPTCIDFLGSSPLAMEIHLLRSHPPLSPSMSGSAPSLHSFSFSCVPFVPFSPFVLTRSAHSMDSSSHCFLSILCVWCAFALSRGCRRTLLLRSAYTVPWSYSTAPGCAVRRVYLFPLNHRSSQSLPASFPP